MFPEIDFQNRLIRYIFVNDVFVNYELIKQGYALAVAYQPNVACADYFSSAQSDAQTELVGLWSPFIIATPTKGISSGGSGGKYCCKVCTTGKACGDSCISKDRACYQPPGCACD